jgi:catechol 2,3-dioxygenase-like lactoylglutathione lyase family enzyme
MLLAIDHIEIIVKDVDATVAWYRSLGLELVRRTDHHGASAELRLPSGTVIELHQVEKEENIGINHIAFRVEDGEAAAGRLEELGIPIEAGPKYFEPTGRTLVNFRDPAGWRLQLVSHDSKERG